MDNELQKLHRKEYNRKYYLENKEKIIKRSVENQTRYYKENPAYYNAYSKRYYEAHKDYFKIWHQENAEYMKQYKKEYYKTHNGKEYNKNYQRVKRSVNCLPLDNKVVVFDSKLDVQFED